LQLVFSNYLNNCITPTTCCSWVNHATSRRKSKTTMKSKPTKFALLYGNRGFFPGELQEEARDTMPRVLHETGHDCVQMDKHLTHFGAVETPAEGEAYAEFLKSQDDVGGVVVCLPNFGDETGAISALKKCSLPILIQAYPDELDKMNMALRRDAFCGKFSIMDVFVQYGLPFTNLVPHTVHPENPRFVQNIDFFDKVCRVVNGMKGMTVGAIGARTTAFKTVRIDEQTLQKNDITVETFDLSAVFAEMDKIEKDSDAYTAKLSKLETYTCWRGVPEDSIEKIVKLGAVIDKMIEKHKLDAVAIRCWVEMQQILGISPCVLLSELNDRGVPAACEVDIGNAVVMFAFAMATGLPPICLDWNNNFGDEDEKCILFHCGPVAQSLMTGLGQVVGHGILDRAEGVIGSYGCNQGRIAPNPMTYGSLRTENGKMLLYLGEGKITEDKLPEDFFGCAGVAEIADLQRKLAIIGQLGHRHHVSVVPGHVAEAINHAWTNYMGFNVTYLDMVPWNQVPA
jgi:L-fucose isomerase-like protein